MSGVGVGSEYNYTQYTEKHIAIQYFHAFNTRFQRASLVKQKRIG